MSCVIFLWMFWTLNLISNREQVEHEQQEEVGVGHPLPVWEGVEPHGMWAAGVGLVLKPEVGAVPVSNSVIGTLSLQSSSI